MRRAICAAALAGLPAVLAGCLAAVAVGAAAAGGAYLYVQGELVKEYSCTVNQSWNASIDACKELGLAPPGAVQKPDAFGAEMSSRRSDGTHVTVKMRAKGDNRTTVGVRFGAMGDENASKTFHGALAKRLGAGR
jgi:hypothetical protein